MDELLKTIKTPLRTTEPTEDESVDSGGGIDSLLKTIKKPEPTKQAPTKVETPPSLTLPSEGLPGLSKIETPAKVEQLTTNEPNKVQKVFESLYDKMFNPDTSGSFVAPVGEGLTPEQKDKAVKSIEKGNKDFTDLTGGMETVKLPGIDRGFDLPYYKNTIEGGSGGNQFMYGGLFKNPLEAPEKIVRTVTEPLGITDFNYNNKDAYQTTSYGQRGADTAAALEQNGMPTSVAVLIGAGASALELFGDVGMLNMYKNIFRGIINGGAAKVADGFTSNLTKEEVVTAYEYLGKPKTMEEAKANFYKLQHQFHPDKAGGSSEISAQLNKAWDILRAHGIPDESYLGSFVDRRPTMPKEKPKMITDGKTPAPETPTITPNQDDEIARYLQEDTPNETIPTTGNENPTEIPQDLIEKKLAEVGDINDPETQFKVFNDLWKSTNNWRKYSFEEWVKKVGSDIKNGVPFDEAIKPYEEEGADRLFTGQHLIATSKSAGRTYNVKYISGDEGGIIAEDEMSGLPMHFDATKFDFVPVPNEKTIQAVTPKTPKPKTQKPKVETENRLVSERTFNKKKIDEILGGRDFEKFYSDMDRLKASYQREYDKNMLADTKTDDNIRYAKSAQGEIKKIDKMVEEIKSYEKSGLKDSEIDTSKQVMIDGKIAFKSEQIVTKSDLKKLLKNLDEEDINVTVDGDYLVYKTDKREIKIKQTALGLVKYNKLKDGDIITISQEDLNADGKSVRVVNKEGDVLASKANNTGDGVGNYEKRDTAGVAKPENLKLFRATADLIKKYATRVAEGNVESGALGTFNPKSWTIRTKGMNDLSTIMHEITHHIDLFNEVTAGAMEIKGYSITGNPVYEAGTKEVRKELTRMYIETYPGAKSTHRLSLRLKEGYAKLLENYIEAPTWVKENYPLLVKEFLTEGGKFYKPVITDILNDVEKIIKEYQTLDPEEKILTRITHDTNITGKEYNKTKFEEIVSGVTTQIVDQVFPIKKFADIAGVKNTVDDPTLYIRHYSNTAPYFANNVEGKNGYWMFRAGEFEKVNEKNWGDLLSDLHRNNTLDKFDAFLVGRRTHFEYEELKEIKAKADKLSEALEDVKAEFEATQNPELEAIIQDTRAKLVEAQNQANEISQRLRNDGITEMEAAETYTRLKDKFTEEEKLFDNLTKRDLDMMSDSDIGLISQEEYEKLTSKKGYASFKREMYNEILGDEQTIARGMSGKGKASFLMKRKGSSKTIISPTYSGIFNHSEALRKSMRQLVYNKMAALVDTGKVDDFMSKVELKKVVDDSGKISYPQDKSNNIIMARVDGQRVPIETDAFIKNVLEQVIDHSSVDHFGRLLTNTTNLFTKGTTTAYPWFAIPNLAMDQMQAFVMSDHGFIPVASSLKNLYKVLSDKKGVEAQFFKEYLTLVGNRNSIGRAHDFSPKEFAEYVSNEKHWIDKMIDIATFKHVIDIAAKPAEFSENLTRGTEYVLARKAGKSQVEAMEAAAKVSGTFSRTGKWFKGDKTQGKGVGQYLIKTLPFFNPTVQISANVLERMATSPAGRKNAIILAIGLIAASLGGLNLITKKGTEEQKDIYRDLPASDLDRYVFVPSTDGKSLLKFRVPEYFQLPASLINMLLAQKWLNITYSKDDYVDAMTTPVPTQFNATKPKEALFSMMPQPLSSVIYPLANISTYPRVHPLKGMGMENLPPGQRTTPSTSALARKMGEEFNWDPIVTDQIITNIFGRTSGFFTGKPSQLNLLGDPGGAFSQKGYFQSGRRAQEYYTMKTDIDQKYTGMGIADKNKSKTPLTDEEKKIAELHKLIHGYTPNKIPGLKENRVDGIADMFKSYKEALDNKDEKKATELVKKINDEINKIKKLYDKT